MPKDHIASNACTAYVTHTIRIECNTIETSKRRHSPIWKVPFQHVQLIVCSATESDTSWDTSGEATGVHGGITDANNDRHGWKTWPVTSISPAQPSRLAAPRARECTKSNTCGRLLGTYARRKCVWENSHRMKLSLLLRRDVSAISASVQHGEISWGDFRVKKTGWVSELSCMRVRTQVVGFSVRVSWILRAWTGGVKKEWEAKDEEISTKLIVNTVESIASTGINSTIEFSGEVHDASGIND
ncbi:hypothetical protein DFH07DRAFT_1021032 [Mycena maculata]|uniref:Uncharacterized protein n=1 Tax=Mycena maculata TaxID=230809 RepID=A0AAD7JBE9_9AGAR|nr:hypothetical protein DFH07DRAFT_1021032 [Mycena maculata]